MIWVAFDILTNLFNIWFARRQQDSHICFYTQSCDITHPVPLGNSTVYAWENEHWKKANNVSIIKKIVWPHGPPKRALGTPRDQRPHLEKCCLLSNLAFGGIRRGCVPLGLYTGFLHQAQMIWNGFQTAHFTFRWPSPEISEGDIWQMMSFKSLILKCFTTGCKLRIHPFSSQKQQNKAPGWQE